MWCKWLTCNWVGWVTIRNIKYGGLVYLFIYDYEEKEFIYDKKIELHPLVDSFSLPQLHDRANLCENDFFYSRKGISIKMKANLEESSGICQISFDWSMENEFNFRGVFVKNTKTTENYSDLRALDKEKKYFFFNQKEYLNKCAFSLDIQSDLIKPPSDIEIWQKNAESKPAQTIYSEDIYTELNTPAVRFGTPDMSEREDCYGLFDYGRGVFTYKANWFWTWGQGIGSVLNEDHEEENVKIALNFGGGIMHEDHRVSNEDYVKINDKVILLNPVEMVYDKLNRMNGFVFKTAEEFKDRPTQTVNLVLTTNREKIESINFLVLKVRIKCE